MVSREVVVLVFFVFVVVDFVLEDLIENLLFLFVHPVRRGIQIDNIDY